jgi:hypothetical protein
MSASTATRELRPVPSVPVVAPSSRRAALLVHAMAERDRAWLLAQLGPQERAQLEPLLAELRTLGIPADRALLEEAIAGAKPADSREPGTATADAAAPASLRRADPGELAAILRGEPAVLVAKLCRMAEWPWRDAVLRKLGSAARKQVELALGDLEAPPGEAFQQHLVAALVRRLGT